MINRNNNEDNLPELVNQSLCRINGHCNWMDSHQNRIKIQLLNNAYSY